MAKELFRKIGEFYYKTRAKGTYRGLLCIQRVYMWGFIGEVSSGFPEGVI